jgi:hypothetical protein
MRESKKQRIKLLLLSGKKPLRAELDTRFSVTNSPELISQLRKEGEMQAALCYNKMAKKYFGEFAIQNELPSSLQLTDPPKYIQNKVLEWLEINGHTDVSVNKIAESLSINPNSIYLPIRYLERKNKIKITSRYPTRVIINVEANG